MIRTAKQFERRYEKVRKKRKGTVSMNRTIKKFILDKLILREKFDY